MPIETSAWNTKRAGSDGSDGSDGALEVEGADVGGAGEVGAELPAVVAEVEALVVAPVAVEAAEPVSAGVSTYCLSNGFLLWSCSRRF
jgi:hypothetical protein